VFGIGVDVTDRRALERRAANAEALSTMGTLALGLAHEIRNPLNAAVLQMHLLGRQVEREVQGHAQRSMRDACRSWSARSSASDGCSPSSSSSRARAAWRVSRSRSASSSTASSRCIARRPRNAASPSCAAATTRRSPRARRSREAPPGVRQPGRQRHGCDAERREIRITARAAIDRVIVEVADTGSGIAEADLVRLFDRSSPPSREAPGSGSRSCEKSWSSTMA